MKKEDLYLGKVVIVKNATGTYLGKITSVSEKYDFVWITELGKEDYVEDPNNLLGSWVIINDLLEAAEMAKAIYE